jgi:hypothetical protein
MQQADDTHQGSSQPQKHVDKIDPLKLPESVNIVLVVIVVLLIALEMDSEPAKDAAPDEEDDPFSDERNSDIVVRDECWSEGECDCGHDAEGACGDGEHKLVLECVVINL